MALNAVSAFRSYFASKPVKWNDALPPLGILNTCCKLMGYSPLSAKRPAPSVSHGLEAMYKTLTGAGTRYAIPPNQQEPASVGTKEC